MRITILGSLNYDVVTTIEKIPGPGETVNCDGFETHHGGKGANQALAARRLSPSDIQVQMIGRVGNDTFGDDLTNSMTKEGIDMSQVTKVTEKNTGVSTIIVDPTSGENRIMFYPGANGTLTEDTITPDLFKNSDYLVMQNEIPLPVVYKALQVAHKSGVKTIYNPSPVDPSAPISVFSNVDYLVVNSSEAQVLSNTDIKINDNVETARQLLPKISEYLNIPNIIITLGANGSIYKTPEASGAVGACKVDKIVDTTGAGDTFLGAVASKLAQKGSIEDALKFGSKASSVAVTRHGAAEGIPYLSEL